MVVELAHGIKQLRRQPACGTAECRPARRRDGIGLPPTSAEAADSYVGVSLTAVPQEDAPCRADELAGVEALPLQAVVLRVRRRAGGRLGSYG